MTVLPEGGNVHTVVGEHGRTYTVGAPGERCTCPDAEYDLDETDRCKPELRTLVATGHLSVPAWIDRGAVDGLLGAHTEGSPRLAATDGGAVRTADDESDASGGAPITESARAIPTRRVLAGTAMRPGATSPTPTPARNNRRSGPFTVPAHVARQHGKHGPDKRLDDCRGF